MASLHSCACLLLAMALARHLASPFPPAGAGGGRWHRHGFGTPPVVVANGFQLAVELAVELAVALGTRLPAVGVMVKKIRLFCKAWTPSKLTPMCVGITFTV